MIKLGNNKSSLIIDPYGGAIINFKLNHININPLNFAFSKEQMPKNNKEGAPYKGHFLCLGRWGEPSEGEIKAGIPDHGQVANILWKAVEGNPKELKMWANSKLEGLHIERTVQIDSHNPVYMVSETVSNINPLGRLYNMVQHPTLSAPFLGFDTIINCNAETGFNYTFFKDPEKNSSHWPNGILEDKSIINLSSSANGKSSVFSFIINRKDDLGWVSAYSPKAQLLLGYLWKRKDYPWINLWQDWSGDQIRYRGIEFGTTGIHKPFKQILEDGNSRVFGENTFVYIDAGEKVSRSYLSFLYKVKPGFEGVDAITMSNGCIKIRTRTNERVIEFLNTIFKDFGHADGY